MQFRGFCGNEAVKRRLSGAFDSGRVPHGYLIAGPEGSGRHTLAQLIAAAMQCTARSDVPCGVCSGCRKTLSGVHPDVVTVDDGDKKTVSVELVRNMSADVFVRPNEGRRKVYVIPRAQEMTESAQNALLKILEEPPSYAAFLLLTTNAGRLLPTVRSRLAELKLGPVGRGEALAWLRERFPQASEATLTSALEASGGFLGPAARAMEQEPLSEQTAQLARCYASGDAMGVLQALVPLEKLKRDQLIPILQQLRAVLCRALARRDGLGADSEEIRLLLEGRTGAQLFAAAESLQSAVDALGQNASVGAVIGWLSVRLK